MNRNARIQTWATLVAVMGLPLLYVGGVHHMLPLSVIGLVTFTAALLGSLTPRFLPQPAETARTESSSIEAAGGPDVAAPR
ncbi:hypothetical protein QIS99_25705 [Streptomyces sp. B-S-A8]|uniref:Uncharacterized protein n=1 Tax=Streptomyces solicavernae TaxID=3043614 RepID=A0ABT6S0Q9_9ACTN|nr:hypothetical protein [Streptomyces sp. B-S-A8]MDI3389558.1 hypothetical protein [Streptomyces sp. B-S-A8]